MFDKMRILLLSLYYPPLNTIAAMRARAFQEYLSNEGHTVDVITRYYDNEQQKGQSMFLGMEPAKGFEAPYVRNNNVIYTNFEAVSPALKFSSSLPPGIRGLYNYCKVDIYHYGWIPYVITAFEKEFSKNDYDFIISSYGPPVSMVVARALSRKYKIPYIIDFRDSFINEEDVSFHRFAKRIVQNIMLKDASALLFASKGMAAFFARNSSAALQAIPSCIVYNGVEDSKIPLLPAAEDESVVAAFKKLQSRYPAVLLHTGTVYNGQDINFFIHAAEQYNSKKNGCAIVFLGLSENGIAALPQKEFIHFLPKVKHATSLYLQEIAAALLLPVWKNRYTGFSGKTQEYLSSGNFVISSPGPQEDVREFFSFSGNVYIAENSADFESILQKIETGELKKKKILQPQMLQRSYWIRRLSDFLLRLKETRGEVKSFSEN